MCPLTPSQPRPEQLCGCTGSPPTSNFAQLALHCSICEASLAWPELVGPDHVSLPDSPGHLKQASPQGSMSTQHPVYLPITSTTPVILEWDPRTNSINLTEELLKMKILRPQPGVAGSKGLREGSRKPARQLGCQLKPDHLNPPPAPPQGQVPGLILICISVPKTASGPCSSC